MAKLNTLTTSLPLICFLKILSIQASFQYQNSRCADSVLRSQKFCLRGLCISLRRSCDIWNISRRVSYPESSVTVLKAASFTRQRLFRLQRQVYTLVSRLGKPNKLNNPEKFYQIFLHTPRTSQCQVGTQVVEVRTIQLRRWGLGSIKFTWFSLICSSRSCCSHWNVSTWKAFSLGQDFELF